MGSRCVEEPHGVAVYNPDQPIRNEPQEGPQGAGDHTTRRGDTVNKATDTM